MYVRLALRNVRSSARDYSIYFLTLTIAVALFYAFNSIDAQQGALDIRGSHDVAALVNAADALAVDSLLVALLFAFLVYYANNFLIARRRREFGVLLALGMPTGRLAALLSLETAFLGLFALTTGIVAGLGLSLVLSYVSALLLGTTVAHPAPAFSPGGLGATLVSFFLVFVLVTLGNVVTIMHNHPSAFLARQPRRLTPARRSPLLGFALLAASLTSFVYSAAAGSPPFTTSTPDDDVATLLALNAFGTFSFFAALAILLPALADRRGALTRPGLRSFTIRQLAERARGWLSLWLVAMTILASLTVLAAGVASAARARQSMPQYTRFDATWTYSFDYLAEMKRYDTNRVVREAAGALEESDWNLAEAFDARVPQWRDNVTEALQVDVYETGKPDDGFSALTPPAEGALEAIGLAYTYRLVGLSQYNALARATGGEQLLLSDSAYAIDAITPEAASVAEAIAASSAPLTVNGRALASSRTVVRQVLATACEEPYSSLVYIVDDSLIAAIRRSGTLPTQTHLNVLLTPQAREEADAQQLIVDLSLSTLAGATDTEGMAELLGVAETSSNALNSWNTRILSSAYDSAYLGLVLLLVATAVLSLRELSETAESARRYRTLAQLGAHQEDLERSLGWRTAFTFLVPLGLALAAIHSGIRATNTLKILGPEKDLTPYLTGTALAFAAVYLIYMAATFALAKNVLRAHGSEPRRIA